MGSTCVRHCERTTAHEYASEDCLPGIVAVPGLSSANAPISGSFAGRGGHLQSTSSTSDGNSSIVPPVPNWFQALKRSGENLVGETPRFDEVMMSPVGPAGSQRSHTTNATPAGVSPRESPRPPDEKPGTDANLKSDEISYEGTYLGAMKHGTGCLRMNGCTYEGDFLNDHKHGNGVLTWDDGRQYSGQFRIGKFHGSAVMAWPDGRKYVGEYTDDKKHGEGTFSWQDGRRYQGQWVVGKRHGIGIYTNAKGLTRTGMWQMDRPLHWEVPQLDQATVGASASPSAPLSQRAVAQDVFTSLSPRGGDAKPGSATRSSPRPPPVQAQQPAHDCDMDKDGDRDTIVISAL